MKRSEISERFLYINGKKERHTGINQRSTS